jgi:hypothetical protein
MACLGYRTTEAISGSVPGTRPCRTFGVSDLRHSFTYSCGQEAASFLDEKAAGMSLDTSKRGTVYLLSSFERQLKEYEKRATAHLEDI